MPEEISFGAWLRKQRRALDLSQKALANQVGCAEVTLRRIESGRLKPSKELANLLLEKLGISESERSPWISFARGLSGFPLYSTPSSNKQITNLPIPLTTFIGREKEQREILEFIRKYRLVTLVGSGGMGKTRLSLKVGEQLLGDYANGVSFVEFTPILDPLLVPHTTAFALGLHDEPHRVVIDILSDYLRQKHILLILDNCEHLIEACAQLADTLLKRCPSLKILATSREALGILGEAMYRIPSLELPDLEHSLEKFREYESVRLFEERAQLLQKDFSLTIENAPSVAKICNQLDGIPLAIELAAARVSMLSTEQIAARLQESFSFLTTGNRTALPRQQTLQATIDWSYELLSSTESILLRRVAVFRGGWTLESAEAVCAGEAIDSSLVMDLLSKLVDKSLVLLDNAGHYKFLETIRQYAHDRLLESGEIKAVRQRHLMYFLTFTEKNGQDTMGSNQIAALQQLDEQYENIREAMDWAIETGQVEEATQMGEALGWFYWWSRALYKEAYERMTLIVNHPATTKEKLFRATALILAVFYGSFIGLNSQQSRAMLDEAIEILEPAGDIGKKWRAWAYAFWGHCMIGEDNSVAEKALDMASSMAKEMNDMYLLAVTIELQGDLAEIQKDYFRAQEFAYECLKLFREMGNQSGVARASGRKGFFHYLLGDYDAAQKYFEEALTIHRSIADRPSSTLVYGRLGRLAALTGKYIQAEELFEQKLFLAKYRGRTQEIGTCIKDLAYLHLYRENPASALPLLRESLSLFEDWDEVGISLSLAGIASAIFQLSPRNANPAAQLLSLAQRVIDSIGIDNLTYEKGQITKTLIAVRAYLGEADYQKFVSEGNAMTLDAAITLAQEVADIG